MRGNSAFDYGLCGGKGRISSDEKNGSAPVFFFFGESVRSPVFVFRPRGGERGVPSCTAVCTVQKYSLCQKKDVCVPEKYHLR